MKKIILLSFEIEDEPNEDKMTAIELDGNNMTFHGFSGFAARDILNLVTEGGYYLGSEVVSSCDAKKVAEVLERESKRRIEYA